MSAANSNSIIPNLPTACEINTLLSTGRLLNGVVVKEGFRPGLVIPSDHEFIPLDFEEDEPLPDHIKARVQMRDSASFIEYVKDYQTPQTRVFFASPVVQKLLAGEVASFTAVIDYHDAISQQAKRVAHTARYDCPYSIEWGLWTGVSGKALKQEEFINFVEANGPDIGLPDSAHLIEMAINFEAATNGKFSNKVDRMTGGRVLHFSEEIEVNTHAEGKRIPVPDRMRIKIPVFDGGAEYELDARLAWVPSGGKLTVTIILQRPHITLRKALVEVREAIAVGLGLKILTGQLL